MRYLLMIYTNETTDAQKTPQDDAALMEAYNAFNATASEQIVLGEALMPTSSATTVRVRNGQTLITDGPFAESKEQLGGFYLVQAANLDEALALGAQIPNALDGAIEVRPIMEFS